MIVLFALVVAALSASGNVVVTKQGETATLECGVDTFTSLSWHRADDVIISIMFRGSIPLKRPGSSDLAQRSRLKGSNLMIPQVDKADAGLFRCSADRSQREIMLFVISVWATPSHVLLQGSEATLHCEVSGPDPQAQAQWTKPDGSPLGSGLAQLKPVSSSDAGTWKCSFSSGKETYNRNLDVTVKVPTPTTPPPPTNRGGSKGVNNPSGNGGDTGQPTHRPELVLLGLIWWLWVAIGVGCLVVVVLSILVICFFRRNRRKKRKIQQLKNGLHLRTPVQYCQCGGPTAAARPQQKRRREKPSAPRYEHPPGGVTQKAAHERERRQRE